MSISDRLMKKLKSEKSSHQERYYYLMRCMYNRDIAFRNGDKLGTTKFQFQADQIANIVFAPHKSYTKPPDWLASWAPEECKKFWVKQALHPLRIRRRHSN